MKNKIKEMLREYGLIDPEYCNHCGRKLERHENIYSYSEITGKPNKKQIILVCPQIMDWAYPSQHFFSKKEVKI